MNRLHKAEGRSSRSPRPPTSHRTHREKVRDRIRKVESESSNYDVQCICRELEDLLFEDFTGGDRIVKIELIAAYLGRMGAKS